MWLSHRQTDIVTPNQFSALETCTMTTTPAFVPWTFENVKQFSLDSIKDTANSLCEFGLKEKGRKECNPEGCFWHKWMESELKQLKTEKPREEENKHVPSPKQPNTGSQRRKRDPSSESLDHRPLKRGTSRDSEQTNWPTSKQNNQSGRTSAEGKLPPKPAPEMCHNFQRRFCGKMTTPGMAMWVAQRLAEAKEEQQKGILSLWAHTKRQAEVTEETINAINGLLDEDAIEALKELRRTKRFV